VSKWWCLLMLASCVLAEDQPAGHESAIVFMQRVLTETKANGIEALRAHVIYQEGKVVSPDLTTSMSEWIAAEKRNGWITKPIAEHGGNDFKMLVMQRGHDIDPLFVVWTQPSSAWKVVWQSSDEDHFIGREQVQALRKQFNEIEAAFRAERKQRRNP
jgi:hypothetical protein